MHIKQVFCGFSVYAVGTLWSNALFGDCSNVQSTVLQSADEKVVIDKMGELYPAVQFEGHDGAEITGLAFSPDGKRLWFSSQRGASGLSKKGIGFEIIRF